MLCDVVHIGKIEIASSNYFPIDIEPAGILYDVISTNLIIEKTEWGFLGVCFVAVYLFGKLHLVSLYH